MGLAIGGAARHHGADARRQLRIKEIDIERHVQHAAAGLHPLDDLPDQHADPEFIDLAHIGDGDAALLQQQPLLAIDRPHPEQLQLLRSERHPRLIAEQLVEPRLAAQERGRHAVHIAGDGGARGVVIGVGVEPEQEQLTALLLPIARHAIHRSHRQRVIAAQEQRNGAAMRKLIGASADRARPALNVAILPRIARRALSRLAFGHDRQVAVVFDHKAK